MFAWLDALLAQADAAVLITVAWAEGSVPREAGAKMLVTRDGAFDTIGGGHLEQEAIIHARALLAGEGSLPRLRRFALGPTLGQCCGGAVSLAFDCIDDAARAAYRLLAQRLQHGHGGIRASRVDETCASCLLDDAGVPLAGAAFPGLPIQAGIPANAGTCLHQPADGSRWLIDAIAPPRAHLMLFGAGHVGAAIVNAMAGLPCRITWVDERDDIFPATIPANVRVEATDTPEALIDAAPPGTSFLVMTHSHPLDQQLSHRILLRSDFAWFGLIGSRTKRIQFERRLRERGIADAQLARMTCPIGLPGIAGKQPAVIAVAVAAQLLQTWERQASISPHLSAAQGQQRA
ncbi:xanthine dehydrogenase accessory factor [Noviherbaspirillum humi]|uniref:Xanthine dehydrogenase accessory factor n=2 Tax=Noviherbaspirillum humi TaxID=1688639 RepID=A0A239HU21_9BURK|nr:xanthine dehydrogenase accessory factor [Noviherbaspirillum humi]